MEFKDFINKDYTYAIVGATNNPAKYGHRVLVDLHDAGYTVIPINLKEDEILGLKAYPTIKDAKKDIDVVVFIIPPDHTEKVLEEVKELGLKKVWMQPGSESEKAITFCKQNDISCIHHDCIMVERHNI